MMETMTISLESIKPWRLKEPLQEHAVCEWMARNGKAVTSGEYHEVYNENLIIDTYRGTISTPNILPLQSYER
jgi:hypothetical protein